jgi:hypothetical protein
MEFKILLNPKNHHLIFFAYIGQFGLLFMGDNLDLVGEDVSHGAFIE